MGEEGEVVNWILTPTQREYGAAYKISEQLRHERLAQEASLVDWQESTPLGEPTPPISMARYRKAMLDQQTQQLRDIWQDYDDNIQL
jgi:hypothetical protein